MTDNIDQNKDFVDDIDEARAARADATAALSSIRDHRSALVPLWERINSRRLENHFGRDFDLSITPRKAS